MPQPASDRKALLFFLFAALVLLFAVLSLAELSLHLKVWSFFGGLITLGGAVAWVLTREPAGKVPLWSQELVGLPPAWVLALLALAAIGLRFYRIGTLFQWPGIDETLLGMSALKLSEHWDWKFFYTCGQVAPTPIWAAALLVKMGVPVPDCLWIPSALVSTLTVFAGYAAARNFLSRSLSLVLGCLFAFSFWPFLLGRICHEGVWVPLWVCLCLWSLGRVLRAEPGSAQERETLALGIVTGSGFWTFTPWPAMALAVGLGLAAWSWTRGLLGRLFLGRFLPGAAFALLPFGAAIWTEGYGQHIQAMFAGSGWMSRAHQVWAVLSNVSELFVGSFQDESAYIAPRGGMLNPILGALFVLGAASLARHWKEPVARWTLLAFFLAMGPGFASMNVETFRIVGVLPILLFIVALGTWELAARIPSGQRGRALALLLALGALEDGWRTLGWQAPLPENAQALRDRGFPSANVLALRILREEKERYGPGAILTEFTEMPFDESLFNLTYGFNRAENPRLHGMPLWAAVVTNQHYLPFLEHRFKGALWIPLGHNEYPGPDVLLGVIPFRPENQKDLLRWWTAHHYFRQLSLAINVISEPRTYAAAEGLFRSAPEFLAADPFLSACYWERRSEFFYRYEYQKHFDDQVQALKAAVEKGYPSAHLYYKLGCLYMRKKETALARANFERGLKREPGYGEIRDALGLLAEMEKGTFPAKVP